MALAAVAVAGIAIGAAAAAVHLFPLGFLLVIVPTAFVALTSSRRAAVAIALSSPVVAVGSVDVGFHLLPCYPLIAAGMAGVIVRREWRIVALRSTDFILIAFCAVATVVTLANLGVHPGTTVVGATGANSVALRPLAQLVALLAMGALYAVVRAGVRRPDDLRAVCRALVVATLFVAAYAAYQIAGRELGLPYTFVNERRAETTLPVNLHYIRPNSTLPEASPLAQFAFIGFFLGIAWLLVRRSADEWPSRRSAALVASVGATLVFASLSKAAWVAGAICLPVIIWRLTRRQLYAAIASVAVGGTVLIAALLRANSPSVDARAIIESEQYVRVGYWVAAVKTAAEHPLGVGVGNFPFHYPQSAPLSAEYEYFSQIADAHNLFLEAAAETGLIGAALFLAFVLGVLLRGVRFAARVDDESSRAIALALAGSYAAGMLMHLTYSYFYYPFEWVLAGLLGSLAIPISASVARPAGNGIRRPDQHRTDRDRSAATPTALGRSGRS